MSRDIVESLPDKIIRQAVPKRLDQIH